MKRKIVLLLTTILCMTGVTPVFAKEYHAPDTADVPVEFSKDSYFTVTLPESISGDSNTTAAFNYSVEGDIASDKTVSITIDDADADKSGSQFVLTDVSGRTKSADIEIEKSDFASTDIVTKQTCHGSVTFADLSAGTWSGNAKFIIGMNGAVAHTHSYASVITTPATCTTDGLMTYTCSCGDSYTEPIKALGHTWNDGKCATCGISQPAGLYYTENGKTVSKDWNTLISDGTITVEDVDPYDGSSVVKGITGANITQSNSQLVIDSTIKSIGDYQAWGGATPFMQCTNLSSVIIPDSVVHIGKEAFVGCTNLKSIKLGNGVKIIKAQAFSDCTGVDDIMIPNSVKNIGSSAFYNVKHITYHGSATEYDDTGMAISNSTWGANARN